MTWTTKITTTTETWSENTATATEMYSPMRRVSFGEGVFGWGVFGIGERSTNEWIPRTG